MDNPHTLTLSNCGGKVARIFVQKLVHRCVCKTSVGSTMANGSEPEGVVRRNSGVGGNDRTALHVRALYGRQSMEDTSSFLELCPDGYVDSVTTYGVTPLHWACQVGDLKLVEFLLSAGADARSKTKYGYSPLHYAAMHGSHVTNRQWRNGSDHAQIANLLVSKFKLDPTKNTEYGSNCFGLIVGDKTIATATAALFRAVASGTLKQLQMLNALHVDFSSTGIDGKNIVQVALYEGREGEIIDYCCKKYYDQLVAYRLVGPKTDTVPIKIKLRLLKRVPYSVVGPKKEGPMAPMKIKLRRSKPVPHLRMDTADCPSNHRLPAEPLKSVESSQHQAQSSNEVVFTNPLCDDKKPEKWIEFNI
jgi:hypothetical protein